MFAHSFGSLSLDAEVEFDLKTITGLLFFYLHFYQFHSWLYNLYGLLIVLFRKQNRTVITIIRRLPGRRALVVVFIKNVLFEIIAFVVFECL